MYCHERKFVTVWQVRGKYKRGLHHTIRHKLHWLDMIDRIEFRIAAVIVHCCLHGIAPEYFTEICVLVIGRPSLHTLWSASSNQLIVPPVEQSTFGGRAFSVSGPAVWNNLPAYLSDPTLSLDSFRQYLKTYYFACY